MQYTKLEGIDKEISRLIYGCGNDVLRGTDPEAAAECLDALKESMAAIGYEVVVDRGDFAGF